jgi:hypothetical protein
MSVVLFRVQENRVPMPWMRMTYQADVKTTALMMEGTTLMPACLAAITNGD